MRNTTITAAIAALALAGCGGDDSEKAATTPAPTAEEAADAKGAIRNAATAVETCFTTEQDYTRCTSAQALAEYDVEVGTEPGQVVVEAPNATAYSIKALVGDVTFSLMRGEDGPISRGCAPAGGAGCPATGTW